ncbi:MAG: hypothetical protein ACI8ZM_004107 [Crocinitomix sp.]|jgi:hypothetical protein
MKILLILLLLFVSPNFAVFGQTFTQEIFKPEKVRGQFHYTNSGESKIQYKKLKDAIIRIEDNRVQLLDEKFQLVDELNLPEQLDDMSYNFEVDEQYIYLIQSYPNKNSEEPEHVLHLINRNDFATNQTIKIENDRRFESVEIILLNGHSFLVFTDKRHLMRSLQEFTPETDKFTELNYREYANSRKNETIWHKPVVKDAQLFFQTTSNSVDRKKNTSFMLYFDENFKLIKQTTSNYNMETGEVITTGEDGEETTTSTNIFASETEYDPYALNVNGTQVWIKTVVRMNNFIPSIETWISYDKENFEINLNVHLKKEFKAVGIKKNGVGINAPIVRVDPINNSITAEYRIFKPGLNPDDYEAEIIYFNLNTEFRLRNVYKLKMEHYPIENALSQMVKTSQNLHTDNKMNSVFKITDQARKWAGETANSNDNVYDFLFSQDKIGELCTVIQTNDSQILFIDKEDGSTTGYVFSK